MTTASGHARVTVNPASQNWSGLTAYPSLADLPERVESYASSAAGISDRDRTSKSRRGSGRAVAPMGCDQTRRRRRSRKPAALDVVMNKSWRVEHARLVGR